MGLQLCPAAAWVEWAVWTIKSPTSTDIKKAREFFRAFFIVPLNRLPEEIYELCGIARLLEKVGTRKEFNPKGSNLHWTELQGQGQFDHSNQR